MVNLVDSPQAPRLQPLAYLNQLDGLRALAVLGVLSHHFLPETFLLNAIFQVGPFAVRLFFVLSGLLITRILLRQRDEIAAGKSGFWQALRKFHVRRSLRLLPIYFLTILLITVFAFEDVRPSLVWHLTYMSNFYFSFHPFDAVTAHFWSLAVEAQFYLVWPFFILCLPRPLLLPAMIGVAGFGVIFRYGLVVMGLGDGIREYILAFSCLDALGLGSILAYLIYHGHHQARRVLGWLALGVSVPLMLTPLMVSLPEFSKATWAALGPATMSLFSVWIIGQAVQGFKGVMGSILEARSLVFLGTISYGIYLYHLPIAHLLGPLLQRLMPPQISFVGWFTIWCVVLTLVTVGIAHLSWRYIEQPLSRLKEKVS